jgi:hypothetical protein
MARKLGGVLVAILLGGGIICVFARALVGPRQWGGSLDAALMLPIGIGFLIEAFVSEEFYWAKTHRSMPTWLGRLFGIAGGGFFLFAAWRIWHQ